MRKKHSKTRLAINIFKIILLIGAVIAALYLPGNAEIQVDQYNISLPSGTFIACLLILFVFFHKILLLLRWLKHLPDTFNEMLYRNRKTKAQNLVLESFTAIAAGEHATAIDLAQKAVKLDKEDPFISVILAQATFIDGKLSMAEELFNALLKNDKTKFLGLRGLIQLRQKQNRDQEIIPLLKKALVIRPTSYWVLQQLFEINVRQLEFEKAEVVIEQLHITGGLSKKQSRRSKAVLLWVKADNALKTGDFDTFYESCLQALKLAPDLIVAAVTLAKYYQESNRFSKAWKTLFTAYQANPNIAFLKALKSTLAATSPLEIYQQAEELVSQHPQHPASLMILGQLAIEAQLWGQARLHLNLLRQKLPTQSYFRLMAQLEQSEYPNKSNKAEEYLVEASYAPQDPSWICQSCHHAVENWSAFCSQCQSFDSLHWQTPQTKTLLSIEKN